MTVHATLTFESDLQRAIYEHVERHGAVTMDELARSVRVEDGPSASKPARSGTYAQRVRPEPDRLREAVETLDREGYLDEHEGTVRVALSAEPRRYALETGPLVIRPVRESDRAGLIETMRAVAAGGTYVVAEDVADRIERDSALVRANADRSRVFFVAVRPDEDVEATGSEADSTADAETTADVDSTRDAKTADVSGREPDRFGALEEATVVGWLHVDAPTLPALSHTASLTVGVDPDARREGIGSRLLEYGLEWAETVGYEKIGQSLPGTNEEAIAFLEENDWEREGTRAGQYCIDGEYVDEVQLATWLGADRPS